MGGGRAGGGRGRARGGGRGHRRGVLARGSRREVRETQGRGEEAGGDQDGGGDGGGGGGEEDARRDAAAAAGVGAAEDQRGVLEAERAGALGTVGQAGADAVPLFEVQ